MPHIHSVFILIEFPKSLLELPDTDDTDITLLPNVAVCLPVEKA